MPPYVLAICFLILLELAFSCCFFYFFLKFQYLVTSMIGWRRIPSFPFANEQAMGAALSFFILITRSGYTLCWLLGLWLWTRGFQPSRIPTSLSERDQHNGSWIHPPRCNLCGWTGTDAFTFHLVAISPARVYLAPTQGLGVLWVLSSSQFNSKIDYLQIWWDETVPKSFALFLRSISGRGGDWLYLVFDGLEIRPVCLPF